MNLVYLKLATILLFPVLFYDLYVGIIISDVYSDNAAILLIPLCGLVFDALLLFLDVYALGVFRPKMIEMTNLVENPRKKIPHLKLARIIAGLTTTATCLCELIFMYLLFVPCDDELFHKVDELNSDLFNCTKLKITLAIRFLFSVLIWWFTIYAFVDIFKK